MNEKIITVTYTEQEAQTAINLYDIAVKSVGLQVAANAVFLTGKLTKAFSELSSSPEIHTV